MIFFTRKSKVKKRIEELETLHRISLETNKMITQEKNIEIAKLEELHNNKSKAYKCIIDYKNEEFERLENEKSKLYTKMIVNDRNLDNCFKVNARITKELEEANLKIIKLEKNNTSLVKRNEALKKLYNKYKDFSIMANNLNINVLDKLLANKEAKMKLIDLTNNDEMKKIHKFKARVRELAMLIGI